MHPLIPYFEQPTFEIGPLAIHGFGILVAIGFWVGGELAQRRAVRFTEQEAASERIHRVVGWLVFAAIVGGHLGHMFFYEIGNVVDAVQAVLASPAYQTADAQGHGWDVIRVQGWGDDLNPGPIQTASDAWLHKLPRVWDGLSSFGGFLLGVPLTVLFFRREKLPYWPYADALGWGFAAGFGIGRLGCFWAHDHPGAQTNFWLGVEGICLDDRGAHIPAPIACHDMGLYEALWVFGILGVFFIVGRKPRAPGTYIGLLALLYGPARIAMDFLRSNYGPDVRYLGLTPAQYGSLLVSALGVWMLVRTRGKAPLPAALG